MSPAPKALLMLLLATAAMSACSDDHEGDPAAFCAAVSDQSTFDEMFDELDPVDVVAAQASFETALETERRLRALAPAAVRADIDVLVDFFEDLVDGLASFAPEAPDGGAIDSSPVRPPVYDELRPRFDQVEAASQRVALYVSTNC